MFKCINCKWQGELAKKPLDTCYACGDNTVEIITNPIPISSYKVIEEPKVTVEIKPKPVAKVPTKPIVNKKGRR